MIDRVLGFVSDFDLPTAVVSVILGFLLKMAWDVVSSGLRRRRKAIQNDLDWYRELRALARRIVLTNAVTKTYSDKFDVDEDDLDVLDRDTGESVEGGPAGHIVEYLDGQREAALDRQVVKMETLYEELLAHVSTADVDLEDEMANEVENLLFFTFMWSLNRVEASEDHQTPVEERAESIVELCDERIEGLEAELPMWRAWLLGR